MPGEAVISNISGHILKRCHAFDASLTLCPATTMSCCREAVHKLLDANVSGAPVVNQSGHLVGVLTEADVIWKVLQLGLPNSESSISQYYTDPGSNG